MNKISYFFIEILICLSLSIKANHYNILVLPCGGAAGIVPVALLQHLEQHTGLHTTQLFHEIWCASAGSMTAALLTAPTSHYKKAKAAAQFFEYNFANYYSSYFIREAVRNAIGAHCAIKKTGIPIRILTSAATSPDQGNWQLYDFSSDGKGSCSNTKLSLADIVKASCTVYPYLYRTPIRFFINEKEIQYCIDPGSLICNPPVIDPTAYFLQQSLARLKSDESVTIYFLANPFTPSINYHDVLRVLKKYAQPNCYAFYFDDTFGTQPRKQIEIVNIYFTTSCEEIFENYVRNANFATRTTAKLLHLIFEKIVGKENAIANLIAAGVVPVAELKKEANKIIKSSHNFAMMMHHIHS